METDYSVTSIRLTEPDSDSDSDSSTATVSIRFEPGLPGESSSLRLQVGDVGLNLSDGTLDSAQFTWEGVDADWSTDDLVSLSLKELPQNVALRAFDGRGNNLDYPTWGMAGTPHRHNITRHRGPPGFGVFKHRSQQGLDPYKRTLNPPSSQQKTKGPLLQKAPNLYADAVSAPTTSRPNARTISNLVFAQDESVPNSSQASDIVWQRGQFLDHDITLSMDNADEPLPIAVPAHDPVFDPLGTGEATIGLSRSVSDPETGSDAQNPRQQVNAIAAFIDGSQVYGSDRARASALRTNDGTGKLKTSSDGRLLPYNEQGLDNEGGVHRTTLFVAGDVRVNEQIGLTAMHTLFVREHNRLAGVIVTQNPGLSGYEITTWPARSSALRSRTSPSANSCRCCWGPTASTTTRATTPPLIRPSPANSRRRRTGSDTSCCPPASTSSTPTGSQRRSAWQVRSSALRSTTVMTSPKFCAASLLNRPKKLALRLLLG